MLVLKGMGKSIPSIVIRDALMNAKSLQLRPTLCDIMDYSLPGSSVHSILQARILEWVDMLSSLGSSKTEGSNPRLVSTAFAGRFFTTRATWKAQSLGIGRCKKNLEVLLVKNT